MTALAQPGQALVDLVERQVASRRPEPPWLTVDRNAAAKWIATHGFPTRKDEDWRYLPLREVLGQPFDLPDELDGFADRARRLVQTVSPKVGATRLVFVNGRFSPLLSEHGQHPTTTRLGAISEVSPRPGGWEASPPDVAIRHGFGALNLSLCVDGALVDLPPATAVDEPIELVFLTIPGVRPVVASPRSLLHLGEGSRATVVETHSGEPGTGYLATAATEVRLERGARLEHYRLQVEPDDALHLSSLAVNQAAGSALCSHLVATGSRVARHEVAVHLEGEEAEASLDGLYLPQAGQYHDQPILVEHAAPGCVSRQRFVGVIDEAGHGVFNGHVIVRPGASGTDASQSNANLLLSEHAEVDTRPRLEIFADDLSCSHGAAVGRLDPDALFYLRSRGLPEPVARAMLVEGFARQVTERIEHEALRVWAERLVVGRLAAHPDRRRPVPWPLADSAGQGGSR